MILKVREEKIFNFFLAALGSLFAQMLPQTEKDKDYDEQLRSRAIDFLKDNVMSEAPELIYNKKDVEEFISNNIKKLLHDSSEEEFKIFLNILSGLSIFKEGEKELIQIVSEQTGINENTPFEVSIFFFLKHKFLHNFTPIYQQ